jgi:mannose-1-phosphate guanylyltransferase
VQALILAGGEGTRLRPLTSTVPKPVVELVDRPFIAFMIEWLRGHGVDDVILACGFMADGVQKVLGDGSALGVRLRYVQEPTPLGTGGALKYAEDLLAERFLMLNGDVLTDIDLTAQLRQHERTGARVTVALMGVDDPSAYGLVRRSADLAVTEFVEKPSSDEISTHLVNAGSYVIEREVLGEMAPAGTRISIERELFPALVGRGLYGYEAQGYWMDIGTPERYLQATFEILAGELPTDIGRRVAAAGGVLYQGDRDGHGSEAIVHGPAIVGEGCRLGPGVVIGGRTVLGRGVSVAAGSHIERSVVLHGASIGAHTRITDSIVGPLVSIGERCRLEGRVVIGEGVNVGAGNILAAGMRIFPGVDLPMGAIAF